MSDENRLAHLEALRKDARDEIKRRIQQRDQYSMQLTVALGAIAIAAFSVKGTPRLFILAPLVSLYFTALILYSYGIHDMLATYLHNEIEPEFKVLCNMSKDTEWETWYQASGQKPGVRRWFFKVEVWTVTLLSLGILWCKEGCIPGWFRAILAWFDFRTVLAWLDQCLPPSDPGTSAWFRPVLTCATVIYLGMMIWISLFLPRKMPRRKEKNRDWPQGKTAPRWQRAVFLDRDGTINADTHFPYRHEDLEFIPNAIDGLKVLAPLPLDIVVVANQAGIALGFFTRQQMSQFNVELRSRIEAAGARIDAFYFCPHLEPKHLKMGETPCECSKPAPGMLLKAAQDFDIHLRRSFIIGDKTSDIAAGQAVGCITILVKSGKAGQEEGALAVQPTHTVADLLEAARIVQGYIEGESGVLVRNC